MANYKPSLGEGGGGGSVDMATPERLPDALRADQVTKLRCNWVGSKGAMRRGEGV